MLILRLILRTVRGQNVLVGFLCGSTIHTLLLMIRCWHTANTSTSAENTKCWVGIENLRSFIGTCCRGKTFWRVASGTTLAPLDDTPTYCHTVILSYYHTVILSYCHTVILSYCHSIIQNWLLVLKQTHFYHVSPRYSNSLDRMVLHAIIWSCSRDGCIMLLSQGRHSTRPRVAKKPASVCLADNVLVWSSCDQVNWGARKYL